MYTNVESLCCTLETNMVLHVNYTLIFFNVFSSKIAAGRNNEQIQEKDSLQKIWAISLTNHIKRGWERGVIVSV